MAAADMRKRRAEELYLLYFNETLFNRGMITEREHNRMKLRIECRSRQSPPKRADTNA